MGMAGGALHLSLTVSRQEREPAQAYQGDTGSRRLGD